MAKPKQKWFVSSEMFTFSKTNSKGKKIETKSTPLFARKNYRKIYTKLNFEKCVYVRLARLGNAPPRNRRDANKAQSTYLSSKWDAFTVICSSKKKNIYM